MNYTISNQRFGTGFRRFAWQTYLFEYRCQYLERSLKLQYFIAEIICKI